MKKDLGDTPFCKHSQGYYMYNKSEAIQQCKSGVGRPKKEKFKKKLKTYFSTSLNKKKWKQVIF